MQFGEETETNVLLWEGGIALFCRGRQGNAEEKHILYLPKVDMLVLLRFYLKEKWWRNHLLVKTGLMSVITQLKWDIIKVF